MLHYVGKLVLVIFFFTTIESYLNWENAVAEHITKLYEELNDNNYLTWV